MSATTCAQEEKKIEKDQGPFAKLMKSARRTRTLVKVAGGSALAIGTAVVALPFLGAVMMLSLAVGAIAFLITMSYAVYCIRTRTPFVFAVGRGNDKK